MFVVNVSLQVSFVMLQVILNVNILGMLIGFGGVGGLLNVVFVDMQVVFNVQVDLFDFLMVGVEIVVMGKLVVMVNVLLLNFGGLMGM